MTATLFDCAERCLYSADIAEKLAATAAAEALLADPVSIPAPRIVQPAQAVVFPPRPAWVDPRLLKRRNPRSVAGRVALLHAVAHIEFTAIHLAWDIVYRFGADADFCRSWAAVAIEEALHFELLRHRLHSLGADYGDLPVHRGLWELAEQTADDLLARLALVPRYMEARGLDVTPGMIAKLSALGDAESVAVLERILHDEVGHVTLGDHWFRKVCAQRGVAAEDTYFELIARFLHGAVRGPFNHALRVRAGFAESELARLEAMAVG